MLQVTNSIVSISVLCMIIPGSVSPFYVLKRAVIIKQLEVSPPIAIMIVMRAANNIYLFGLIRKKNKNRWFIVSIIRFILLLTDLK